MTEIVRARELSISLVQAAGNGSFGTAAAVDIPTANSMLLVELPVDGLQGIKLPIGYVGDRVDIFTISKVSSGSPDNVKLSVFDADGNGLAGTATSSKMKANERIVVTKVLPFAYSSSGMESSLIGTWLGNTSQVVGNSTST